MPSPRTLSGAAPLERFALVARHGAAALADPSGEARVLAPERARERLGGDGAIVCHLPATRRRLGPGTLAGLDVLELFAFVRPAEFCRPNPSGLADALDLPAPEDFAAEATLLQAAAGELLAELADGGPEERGEGAAVARAMAEGGWPWAAHALDALGEDRDGPVLGEAEAAALQVWKRLPEWAETAPAEKPADRPAPRRRVRQRLALLVGRRAEDRPQQVDYASAVAEAFLPHERGDAPRAVLAEAGTGTGKTLGYLAPATLWAETAGDPVWISTYTRNLQRQIDDELDRLHPDPREKARKVVVRKGRENYLCLLNYEEALGTPSARGAGAVGLGLLARWARATRSGEMPGGDFPAWLVDLAGRRHTVDLADRRGECIRSACRHYDRCYVEKTLRRSRRADVVIANHALVLAQARLGGAEDGLLPTRLVFDEGHRLFDAADGTFSERLGGRDGAELRRWLTGARGPGRSRARGLESRIGDAARIDPRIGDLIRETAGAALCLPGPNWLREVGTGPGRGAAERFLHLARELVHARNAGAGPWYDLEAGIGDPPAELVEAARAFAAALGELARPASALAERLRGLLAEKSELFEAGFRRGLENAARTLAVDAGGQLAAWRHMLESLEDGTPEEFVEWFSVSRSGRAEVDVAMHRHWIDPMKPFAETVLAPAHGVVVTSATLREGSGDVEADWRRAERRTGMDRLDAPPLRARMASPFDYEARTRVMVVTDVDRNDRQRVARAYLDLFLAAGGGALGLFTAVSRLRAVHGLLHPGMEAAGHPLLAQHVDGLDAGSLVEIFRAEENACLLGTDAMRDGIDVPGRSLRLIVFDRVPWPVPTILHRARRQAFGGQDHDDHAVRMRLKQAFGRLVRSARDAGAFVLLDSRLPTRHEGAFPEGVEIRRLPLAEAVAATREFVSPG